MASRSRKQTGSVHVIIVSVIMIVILGALGFVFWQNFVAKNSKVEPATQPSVKTDVSPKEISYNIYQTDTHPVSFTYPSTWSLSGAQASDDNGTFGRSINVTTDTGDKILFSIGGTGIGGTCGGVLPMYTTLEAVPTKLKAAKPVTLSFTVITKEDGTLEGHYGLTDTYTTLMSDEVCTFYYLFDSKNDLYKLILFSGTKDFKDVADARKFIASVEYAAIKKMILSLTY